MTHLVSGQSGEYGRRDSLLEPQKLIATVVIVALVVAIRFLTRAAVRRTHWHEDDGRRWLVLTRNVTLLVGVAAVAMVWAHELRVVGLSLVAVAVALVISMQDVIRSFVASFVRAASGQFQIGDRITVGEISGYVVDHSMLQTSLLEIGPGHARTGRTISVPNTILLSTPVINETAGHRYILHSFDLLVPERRWKEAAAVLETAANSASAPYAARVQKAMDERATRHSLPLPSADPLVFCRPDEHEHVKVTVRVPVDAASAGRVEHEIVYAWLEHLAPGADP